MPPEYQGAGLGRRMFEWARSDLAAHGYGSFVVWALAGNDRAMEFYRRLGGASSAARQNVSGRRRASAWLSAFIDRLSASGGQLELDPK